MNAFSRSMRKRIFLILYLVVCASGILALALSFLNPPKDCDIAQFTHTVARGTVSRTVEGTAAASLADRISLSGYSGVLTRVAVRDGQAVSKGQLLFELSDSEAEEKLKALQTEIAALEQQIAGYEQSVAALTLRASSGGQVTGLTVQTGASLKKGDAVCTLHDPEYLACTLRFGSEYFGFFHEGLEIELLDDAGNRTAASVTSVGELYATENGRVHDVAVKVKSGGLFTEGIRVQGRYRHDSGVTAYSANSSLLAFYGISVLTSPADGTIESIPVKNGDVVAAGTTVLQLRSDPLTQSLAAARDQLAAKRTQLSQSQGTASSRSVTSPADGTARLATTWREGDRITKSDVLCSVDGGSSAELLLRLSQEAFSLLTVGLPAEIRFPSLPDASAPLTGSVTSLTPPPSGGSDYTAAVTFTPPDAVLTGKQAEVSIRVSGEDDVLSVPDDGVLTVWDKRFVFVKRPGLEEKDRYKNVEERYRPWLTDLVEATETPDGDRYYCDGQPAEVTTGLSAGGMTVISSGLSEGDVVILPMQQ